MSSAKRRPPRATHTRAPSDRRRRRLLGGTEGAAYVEFLIAFIPIFLTFVGLWQLGEVFVARLMLRHAAFAAARAAAVYIPRPDASGQVQNALDDPSRAAVDDAVTIALAPILLRGWLAEFPTITFPNPSAEGATEGVYPPDALSLVHVDLSAGYLCHFPPFDLVFCQTDPAGQGLVLPLEAHASFPYQGASYQYDPQ